MNWNSFSYHLHIFIVLCDYLTVEAENRDDETDNEKTCECEGFSCSCCVDFNMSLIDLVWSGEQIPPPRASIFFAKLAQMCAKFTEFQPTEQGMRACMELEPKLLGEVQLDLPIGCFLMTPEGMEMIDEEANTEKAEEKHEAAPETPSTTQKPETIIGDLTAEDILNVVSDSADKGISMISSWFGISLDDAKNDTETTTVAPAE
uniref:Protein with signal anchor n=1 Tax=Lutzomyia longipalpis TaxID=7200 RepID=A0A1B0CEN5_LUTLO